MRLRHRPQRLRSRHRVARTRGRDARCGRIALRCWIARRPRSRVLLRAWRATGAPEDEAVVAAYARVPTDRLPAPGLPAHRQSMVHIEEGRGRTEPCAVQRPSGMAIMTRLAQGLHSALERTHSRPRLRLLPQEALPVVPLAGFSPRVHNVCSDSFEAAASLAIVAFAAHGRMPEPRSCLVLWSGSTEADVRRFVARWAQSSGFLSANAADDLHCIISHGAEYRLLAAAAASISRWQLAAKAPLLVLTAAEKEDYLASQLAFARTTVQPFGMADAQQCLKAMLGVWTAGAQAVTSDMAGAGKSFAIRRSARTAQKSYVYIPVTAAEDLVAKTSRRFAQAREHASAADGAVTGPTLLHLDLDTLPQQSGELDRMLFSLVLLGQLPLGPSVGSGGPGNLGSLRAAGADMNCWQEHNEELAVEAACGPLLDDVGMLRLLPRRHIVPDETCFEALELRLAEGAIPGREPQAAAMAWKLQQVVAVLQGMEAADYASVPLSAWPVAPNAGDQPVEARQCFRLLAICCPERKAPVSMWALWNLVHVLYWQFSELFSPSGVVLQEANPARRAKLASTLLHFSLSTAKSLAMRQDMPVNTPPVDSIQVLFGLFFGVRQALAGQLGGLRFAVGCLCVFPVRSFSCTSSCASHVNDPPCILPLSPQQPRPFEKRVSYAVTGESFAIRISGTYGAEGMVNMAFAFKHMSQPVHFFFS